jgi:very-short-patch-repair endonuclease
MPNNILHGQRITDEKRALAKTLRQRMTPAENLLWQALRRSQLDGFHFRRQQIIDGFVVDFYCHAIGLVIELDGEIHQQQKAYDAERDRLLQQRGLTVLRMPNSAVTTDLTATLEQIRTRCHQLAT